METTFSERERNIVKLKYIIGKPENYWVTIDPGLGGTGWAVFHKKELKKWGTYYPPKGKDWKEKAECVVNELGHIEQHSAFGRVVKMFCEWPSYQTVAAQNTMSVVKLAYLIGGICTYYTNVTLIPVVKWKGSLPKEVTKKRAERYFHCKGFKSHAADAVGIGQYILENNLI